MKLTPSFGLALVVLSLSSPLSANPLLPADSIPLDSFAEFEATGANWVLASGISGDPRHSPELIPSSTPGTGVLVNIAPKASGENLFTNWEHGDIELSFEFLMPQGSNSGVYLMGRYEIQLFDSWGVAEPSVHDCGAIYERWNETEKRGYEGTAPTVNATRAPGLWQTMRLVFQAPRFNDNGKKTANARFLEVEQNGFLIHQNVEVTGPTRGAKWSLEAAMGPLQIQGDHGPVAFRNITKRLIDFRTKVTVHNLQSSLLRKEESVDQTIVATAAYLDPGALGEPKNFTVTYTGQINAPNSGTYAFESDSSGTLNLEIGGSPAIVAFNSGVRSVPIQLEAGDHPFELKYTHGPRGRPSLALFAEGPHIARHQFGAKPRPGQMKSATITATDEEAPAPDTKKIQPPKEIMVSPPADGVIVHRGFTPFDPRKRLYSIAVGSSTGVHYAYDFETATILRTWNGPFLDMIEFWDGRAQNQLIKPIGPSLTFHDKPTIVLLESGEHGWPNLPEAQWLAKGYALDAKGQPTFFASLAGIEIEDRIEAASNPRRLERHLTLSGEHTSWMTAILLAEAESITPSADRRSFTIGDRHYYLDLAADNTVEPFVRHINGRDQLILYPPKSARKDLNLSYSLVW
jgi:hypothetical protein